jgi:hypothetical protein
MAIRHISECDGPNCAVSVELVKDPAELWPSPYCSRPREWIYFDSLIFHDYACVADYAETKSKGDLV